jgi:hypothetical protein
LLCNLSYDQGYIQIVFKREAEKWPGKKKKSNLVEFTKRKTKTKRKQNKKNSQFLMWKQNKNPPSPPLPKTEKKEPLARTSVFLNFSPPQFCDVAQVVIIHKYV